VDNDQDFKSGSNARAKTIQAAGIQPQQRYI